MLESIWEHGKESCLRGTVSSPSRINFPSHRHLFASCVSLSLFAQDSQSTGMGLAPEETPTLGNCPPWLTFLPLPQDTAPGSLALPGLQDLRPQRSPQSPLTSSAEVPVPLPPPPSKPQKTAPLALLSATCSGHLSISAELRSRSTLSACGARPGNSRYVLTGTHSSQNLCDFRPLSLQPGLVLLFFGIWHKQVL